MSYIWDDFFIKPLLNLLLFLYNNVPGHDLGISIIIITVIIRFILLPLSIKASRSQRKMKRLAPELAKLKETHKDDQQAFAKAQMDFYKQNGVSPIASCLPLLIQLPILIALYRVLVAVLKTINPAMVYSFVHLPEKVSPMFLGILDVSRPEKYVLPVVAGILQYILTVMTTPIDKSKNAGPEQVLNRNMIYMFPLITWFFGMSLPSGIVLYWIATNLFTIGQQVYVNREKHKEVTVRIKKEGEHEVITISEGDAVVTESESEIKEISKS